MNGKTTLPAGGSILVTSSMTGMNISCGGAPAASALLEARLVGYYYYAVNTATGIPLGVGFGDFPETRALLQRAVKNVFGRNACINFDGDHWAVTDIYTGVKLNSHLNNLDQCLVELYAP